MIALLYNGFYSKHGCGKIKLKKWCQQKIEYLMECCFIIHFEHG